jgi:hypothetical protein
MPQASKYAYFRQWASIKPLKCSGGAAMMVMNLASPSSIMRALDQFIAGEKCIRLLGRPPPSIKRIVAGFLAF